MPPKRYHDIRNSQTASPKRSATICRFQRHVDDHDRVAFLTKGITVIAHYRISGYNNGHSSKRSTFANLRAESHWHLRTLLEQGQIALPHDEELFDELAAIRWRATSNCKIQIEPKKELKNRLGRSPYRADAVVLAFSGWAPRKARSTEAVHWG